MRDEGLCGRETVERGLREAKVFGWLKRKKENGFGEGCRLCSGRLREKKKKNNPVGAGCVWPVQRGGSLATGWKKKKIKVGGLAAASLRGEKN